MLTFFFNVFPAPYRRGLNIIGQTKKHTYIIYLFDNKYVQKCKIDFHTRLYNLYIRENNV